MCQLTQNCIKPSTENNTPFGYYDLSFFYLSLEDAIDGSIPHIENENNLYEIDTIGTNNWLEAINIDLDGEENITTSEFIDPKYITKIKDIKLSK